MKNLNRTLIISTITTLLMISCSKDEESKVDDLERANCLPVSISTVETDSESGFESTLETTISLNSNDKFESLSADIFYFNEMTNQDELAGTFTITSDYESSVLNSIDIKYADEYATDRYVYEYNGDKITKVSLIYPEEEMFSSLSKRSSISDAFLFKSESLAKKRIEESYYELSYIDGILNKVTINESWDDYEGTNYFILPLNVVWVDGNISKLEFSEDPSSLNFTFKYDTKPNYYKDLVLNQYFTPYFSEAGIDANILGLPGYFSENNLIEVISSLDGQGESIKFTNNYDDDNLISKSVVNYVGDSYLATIIPGFICED